MPKKITTISSHTFESTTDKNIFRVVDRDGDWTHYWIKSQQMFVPAVNHIIRIGYPKGERFYAYLLHSNVQEAERRLKTAGEEGARTHDAIRDLLKNEEISLDSKYYNELSNQYESLTADEWENLESFAAWVTKYKPEQFVHEYTVWSELYRYAGTVDFIGTILIPEGDKSFPKELVGKRILVLLDWKTSSSIWDEYQLQVAAYRQAVLESPHLKLPYEKYGALWTGIVRLGTNHASGFEVKFWNADDSEFNFSLFCAAYNIFRKKSDPKESEPDIHTIPSKLIVKIPSVKSQKSKKPRKKAILSNHHLKPNSKV